MVYRRDVLLEPPHPLGARDRRQADAQPCALAVDPGERHLGRGDPALLGHLGDRVGDRLVGGTRLTAEPRVGAAEVALVELVGPHGAGQEAPPERGVRHEPDAELLQRVQHRGLDVTGPQRVLGLDGGDRVHRVRAAQQVAVDLREPEVAHLAGLDELRHRPDRLLDLGVLRRPVQVVQVDRLDAEPHQRCVTGAPHVGRVTAQRARLVAAGPVDPELGGELHRSRRSWIARPTRTSL